MKQAKKAGFFNTVIIFERRRGPRRFSFRFRDSVYPVDGPLSFLFPSSPFLSLSGTLYFRFRLILFGNQSSTPPVVSGHGRSPWDMSATSPAFSGRGPEARQKSSIEVSI